MNDDNNKNHTRKDSFGAEEGGGRGKKGKGKGRGMVEFLTGVVCLCYVKLHGETEVYD